MGSVFLAEHLRMGRRDAVKVLSRSVADDEEARARFTREARNASTINHPNVCTVYDFGEILDGLPFIAMEYVEGETLSELMDREGPLSPERAVRIAAQVCAALDAAHRRDIIHRDLKPDNIMLTRDARGEETVKVVDFGIAKAMREEEDEGRQDLTRAGWVVGTPEYVSPEQLKGREMDGRSDLYSLGIVLFRMLSGRLPFGGESWQEVMTRRLSEEPADLAEATGGRVPDGLVRAVRRVLRRNREARHPDAESFREDLMSAIGAAGETGGAPPATVQVREEAGGEAGAAGEPPATSPGREERGAGGRGGGRSVPWRRIGWVAGGAVGIAGLVVAGMALLGDDGSAGDTATAASDSPGDTARAPAEQSPTEPTGDRRPAVAGVSLSLPSDPVRVGQSARGRVAVTDSQGRRLDRPATWRSLDPGTATVGGDGTVTARSPGSARIVALAGGVADTATLSVRTPPPEDTAAPPDRDTAPEGEPTGEPDEAEAEPEEEAATTPEPDPRTVLDRQVDALLLGAEPGPEEARARADTARTYWQRGDLPADLRAHAAWALANSFEIRGRPSDACRWIRRALELTPGVSHYETFRSAVCPQGASEDGEAP